MNNQALLSVDDVQSLDWAKVDELMPAIVQHGHSREVLMLGYMNRDALLQTLQQGKVTFFSRSKQRLWTKGETSGHFLRLLAIGTDCDRDTLIVHAIPNGPVCHLGTPTCFELPAPQGEMLARLDTLIAERKAQRPEGSYTTRLFDAGIRRIAQKVGEEGVETALAAVAEDDDALTGEAADLVYHLMVLLHARGLDWKALQVRLEQRHGGG